VGKVVYIAGHSGPETADDSRTHFGIFEPSVMQLFPRGQVINLHPWEYNEVPVLLGAALKENVPVIVLHLTRPPILIPDRQKLGMASHFEAGRGAYLVRDYKPGAPRGGTVIVQGTSSMVSMVNLLPEFEKHGLNLKIVYGSSPELFALQAEEYRLRILSEADRADSTVISTQSRASMRDWIFNEAGERYALTADWDNRWRTGGTLDEVIDEAHLSPRWLLEGLTRFVNDRKARLTRLQAVLTAALK
jgi:transketolase